MLPSCSRSPKPGAPTNGLRFWLLAQILQRFAVRSDGDRQAIFNRRRGTQDYAVLYDIETVSKMFARSYLGGEFAVR